MAINNHTTFHSFIFENTNAPLMHNEDIVHIMLPLLQQIEEIHAKDLVIPIFNYHNIQVKDGMLFWPNLYGISRKIQAEHIKNWQHYFKQTFAIETIAVEDLAIENNVIETNTHATIERLSNKHTPQYLPNYNSYELAAGHHDHLTDIFCIGQLMASIIFQLDLNDMDDWYEFKKSIPVPIYANSHLHPNISNLITKMTTLNRAERINSISEVIDTLANYAKLQGATATIDPTLIFESDEVTDAQKIIKRLKTKLFDTSKRNRLLYFKQNARAVNLSIGSMPHVLHYEHIRQQDLFIWNDNILQQIQKNKPIQLNQWMKFEDHPYLAGQIDKIRLEDQKNQQEFGFSQLNFVPFFLNWFHYKEDAATPIQSPLLLIPVQIKKTKALIIDQYAIHFSETEAIVNPILAQVLWEHYSIKLPNTVPINKQAILSFFEYVQQAIQQSNSGVQVQILSRPKLHIMHTIANKNRQQYQKTNKNKGTYSLQKEKLNFPIAKPSGQLLGLQLFNQYIKKHNFQLVHTVTNVGKNSEGPSYYEIAKNNENPYVWEIDTCNIVLGNFNTQKMRLVEDYDWMLEQNETPAIIDTLFLGNKKIETTSTNTSANLIETFAVITADPSQLTAIQKANEGDSFVIQGPPGTGKSQTITNIIANAIAAGKHILFVCEKRAALDVVYARLKQQQLHYWCSYIHDSQTDKKTFILDLKEQYEQQLKQPLHWEAIDKERKTLLIHLNNAIDQLQAFHNTLQATPNHATLKIYELIDKLLIATTQLDPHQAKEYETYFPEQKEWTSYQQTLEELQNALDSFNPNSNFAAHPFSLLNSLGIQKSVDIAAFESLLQTTNEMLHQLNDLIAAHKLDNTPYTNLDTISDLITAATTLLPFADNEQLALLNKKSSHFQQFKKDLQHFNQIDDKLHAQRDRNKNWIDKWDEQKALQGLQICTTYENRFFKFLYANWRNTKRQLQIDYNINSHDLKPLWSSVLKDLLNEYDLATEKSTINTQLNDAYALDRLELSHKEIETLQKNLDPAAQFLMDAKDVAQLVPILSQHNHTITLINVQLRQLLDNFDQQDIGTTIDILENIVINIPQLKTLQPILQAIAKMPLSIQTAIRKIPLSVPLMNAGVLQKTYDKIKMASPHFAQFNWNHLKTITQQIKTHFERYFEMNKLWIHAACNKTLHQHIAISTAPNGSLDENQQTFKKTYQEGRKIVEHEFGKSMRYKSIRTLNTSESAVVIQDLKPVWLMSPLSVADIFPIGLQTFDMVIFDEASQITIEDAIPAATRGKQIIIVGDEKQMPPTSFFKTQNQEAELINDVTDIDVDSLLIQGNKKLPNILLNWHYRSRFEPLINFCNYAFYQAQLLTIPDIKNHKSVTPITAITNAEQGANMLDYVLDRSISYHYLPFAVYENRANAAEASYIAQLLRSLLLSENKATVGIVAFSMEQQMAIEQAIESLSNNDQEFAHALDEAYNRYDNEQFVGLIIKNLEQIQGDERDIIIMSIGYGPNKEGKMKMHFGPINQKGGEKRLNVLFSRAKQHMVVIASMQHAAIHNIANEGANYFKHFLQYAQAISEGNITTAYHTLSMLNQNKTQKDLLENNLNIIIQIIDLLEINNYHIDKNIGAGLLKCAIGVKKNPNDKDYLLGIFIDNENHYAAKDAIEPYYFKQEILRNFGWNALLIPAKMWLEEPVTIKGLILDTLNGKNTNAQISNNTTININKYIDNQNVKSFKSNKLNQQLMIDDLKWERYELIKDDAITLFWEIAHKDNQIITRFGKINTIGQTKMQRIKNINEIPLIYEKLINEKLEEGYCKCS